MALAKYWLLVFPVLALAQDGQSRRALNWPCGANLDRSYLQIAESSGGHMLLFAPGEAEKSGAFLIAQHSHAQTIFRASGIALSGPQDFTFPIESGLASVFFSGSAQCLEKIQIFRPNGAELTHDASTQITDFKAGRMVQLPNPEPGNWRIRVSGRGVFSAFALAQSTLGLSVFQDRARIPAEWTDVRFSLISGAGAPLAPLPLERQEDGSYAGKFTAPAVPYRWLVEAKDAAGYPIQRVHPPLFGLFPKPN